MNTSQIITRHTHRLVLLTLIWGAAIASLAGCQTGSLDSLPSSDSSSTDSSSTSIDGISSTDDEALAAGAIYVEAATTQDNEVAVRIPIQGFPRIDMVREPGHGELRSMVAGGEFVELIYVPAAGFVGEDVLALELAEDQSVNRADILIRVYPSIVFTIESEYNTDPLTIRAIAYTIDGSPLPPGTYTWVFEDEHEGGPMATHATRTHTFSDSGLYHVALAITLIGAATPINCAHAQSGKSAAEITIEPRVRGSLRDPAGAPLGGVVVSANNGGATTMTDPEGAYVIRVPYGWSGIITPDLGAYEFSPHHRDYVNLRGNMRQEDYTGTPHGTPTFELPSQHESTDEDTSKVLTLQAGSGTEDLTFLIVDPSQHGRLTNLDNSPPAFATVLLVPDSNFNGSDRFTFKAVGADGRESTVAEFALTVNPVNDAPAFTEPPDQAVVVGETKVVSIANVSTGAPNEADQTVAFAAQSSNQAILPNANIQFTGSPPTVQMSITATGTGTTTLTITAQDNGGTQNGGVDTRQAVVQINAFVGSTIAGAIKFVDTVGHQPPLGVVGLSFNGSGSWEGADFVCQTSHTGAYFQIVPEGWTGTVAATDPNYLLLTPSAHVYNAPVTEPQLDQNFTAWKPPIGIPPPPFGIKETHEMYVGEEFDFDGDGELEPGEEYPDAGFGPYTHYVDNTHPFATDSNNPYGTPDQPRLTVPNELPAGSVVEIHGGPYVDPDGGNIYMEAPGTPEKPIFIRGWSASNPSRFDNYAWRIGATYLVVENLEVTSNGAYKSGIQTKNGNVQEESAYVSIRNCHVHDGMNMNGLQASGHHIVLYNNTVHDVSWLGSERHGLTTDAYAHHIWMVDNHAYDSNGNAIQFQEVTIEEAPQHIYVGRNHLHGDRQAAIATKDCNFVIISQNFCHNYYVNSTFDGAALINGSNGGPPQAWFLFNEVRDCTKGMRIEYGPSTYVIGNLFHDIDKKAIEFQGQANDEIVWIVNNTIYDADAGIGKAGGQGPNTHILNNVLANLRLGNTDSRHISVSASYSWVSAMHDNLLWQNGQPVLVFWEAGGDEWLDSAALNTYVDGTGNVIGDPLFTDPARFDFTPQAQSPALDQAAEIEVYGQFETTFGVDIRTDFYGRSRPQGAGWDIGAFERSE